MRLKYLVIVLFICIHGITKASIARVYGGTSEKPALSSLSTIPKIRVRIKKSLKNVFIAGTDLKRKFHHNNLVNTFRGRKAIKFKCQNLNKAASFKQPTLLASLGSSTGLISLAEEKYKGLLHVVTSKSNDSCDVIHETGIENYLSSLLAREMNAKWPLEALKAQAVAARSYAFHKIKTGQVKRQAGYETYYHIESSEKHQVSGNFFDTSFNTELATEMTKGVVLVDGKGKISPIFFHAKCGGKTLRPEQVWQDHRESYQSVECPYCKDHGSRGYDNTLTLKRWNKFIEWNVKKGYLPNKVLKDLKAELKLVPDKKFARKIRFYLGENLYSLKKTLLRRYFGRVIVPSNNFQMTMEERGNMGPALRLKGDGLGHGVGMCQLGALELADRGWSFEKILAHYFPKHKIKKLY